LFITFAKIAKKYLPSKYITIIFQIISKFSKSKSQASVKQIFRYIHIYIKFSKSTNIYNLRQNPYENEQY